MSDLSHRLNHIKRSLASSQHLSEIWQTSPLLWQEIGWHQSQLRLWLAVLPEIVVRKGESDDPVYQIPQDLQKGDGQADDLAGVIWQIVSASGRPMPVAQVKSKLPTGVVATEPMILAAVREHPKLTTMGPVIKALG
ncbi:hypothetical protein HRM2_49110 [Desulforapulum autotrophicum HRM2]|uniref:Uncharacterized protein n=1 Tax=Desulforapulum autotrophicum (strain ATCC 43914 / DSM 3382 / VKM B-1955 / HRM2) TaxID=177437 RepID=C0QIL5_DESAH|nr:hypothetical protein [Desulforapulum autotrophicum]ACN17959.1 hypothetical protein HRM2_49110 [Desulforapulum autotrophicum HRM2]